MQLPPPGHDSSARQTGATVRVYMGRCSCWHKPSQALQVVHVAHSPSLQPAGRVEGDRRTAPNWWTGVSAGPPPPGIPTGGQPDNPAARPPIVVAVAARRRRRRCRRRRRRPKAKALPPECTQHPPPELAPPLRRWLRGAEVHPPLPLRRRRHLGATHRGAAATYCVGRRLSAFKPPLDAHPRPGGDTDRPDAGGAAPGCSAASRAPPRPPPVHIRSIVRLLARSRSHTGCI
jgi:hypothetical protein